MRSNALLSLASAGLAAAMAPENPSGDYAPSVVDCPSDKPTLREADGLSDAESKWLQTRRPNTVEPMKAFLKQSTLDDFDIDSYFQQYEGNYSVIPNIAISVSGGGYRALMNGAGFLAAADNREINSTNDGQIGGLLQATTYLSALSGGGWLVTSMFANNFSTITNMRDGSDNSNLWSFYNSIIDGPDGDSISIIDTTTYWNDVLDDIDAKRSAGFEVSLTDTWGRMLSYQLINDTNGGPAYTFSSIQDADNFSNGDTPFPMLVAVEQYHDSVEVTLNSSVVEMNAFEFGTWDPTFYGFSPTEYVGSNFSDGTIPSDGSCVRGLDQSGFVFGTSSSLFNSFFMSNLTGSSWVPDFFIDALQDLLNSVEDADNDVAVWAPNPFQEYHPGINSNAGQYHLLMVDGGMALENLPLQPVIQPDRAVDVVFAVDSSADNDYNWPNATALRATYDRSTYDIANGTQFPKVPDAETFINLGLNAHPTFFGCDTSEFDGGHIPPLLVYMPNAPYSTYSNTSTFQLAYDDPQMYDIIQNGWNVATMGNNTEDAGWTGCMACAVMQRSWLRVGFDFPDSCNTCFTNYCWNGTTDSTPVTYQPTVKYEDEEDAAISLRQGVGMAWTVALVTGLAILL